MNDKHLLAKHGGATKGTWAPPTVEEIDFAATENGGGVFSGGDFTTYAS